ncbi:MAG: diguanylate cyclase, partial [Solirubrobacteraceae bacterium]|nr:diguanylate cyclase [Solirubrobacteraceae bacterium]
MTRFLSFDAAERERMYDVMLRLRTPFALALALLLIPAIVALPVYGWVAELPLLAAVIGYAVSTTGMARQRRPELALIAAWAFAELMIMVTIALADGPRAYLFAITMFPMLGMSMVVNRRVAVAGAFLVIGMMGITGVLVAWDEVSAYPPIVLLPMVLILASMLAGIGARDSEMVSRGTAMVDPLTGLLNRVALQTRANEIALQARVTGERVALIVADLDHFKTINDEHGHAVGDAVLAEVGRRLRTEVGADGAVFRFGGEEFVVLLSSTSPGAAIACAERLRERVRGERVDDVRVTASLGVSVSAGATGFDFAQLFGQADAALYEAKQAGRDRVSSALAPIGPAVVRSDDADRRAGAAQQAPGARDGWEVRLEEADDSSWLIPNAVARAHGVDALERTRVPSQLNTLLLVGMLVVGGYWIGFWPVIPAVIAAVFWEYTTKHMPTARRPEYGAFAGLALIIVVVGAAIALTQPLALFALPMLGFVVLGATAGFSRLGAVLLGGLAVVMALLVGLGLGWSEVMENPFILAFPVALIIGQALVGEAMGRSAREHRIAAITDPLTGTLNRAALDARIPALAQLAVDRPISILLADLDHFKRVNDEHGHDVGDKVLQ